MRQTTGNIQNGDLQTENIYPFPANEFFIPKTKHMRYGKGLLKCCATIGIIIGLNAISFYVGYLVASEDSSDSL